MAVSTPRSIGRGTTAVVLVSGLVIGVILGMLAPNTLRGAPSHESDYRLRGIPAGMKGDVRSAGPTGEVSASHVPVFIVRGS